MGWYCSIRAMALRMRQVKADRAFSTVLPVSLVFPFNPSDFDKYSISLSYSSCNFSTRAKSLRCSVSCISFCSSSIFSWYCLRAFSSISFSPLSFDRATHHFGTMKNLAGLYQHFLNVVKAFHFRYLHAEPS